MNFHLTEEQQFLKENARDVAENLVKPLIAEFDEKEEFPKELFKKLGELQYLGLLAAPEYDGAGVDYVSYASIIEEFARIDGSVALGIAAHNSLCSNHIYLAGTEEQKKQWLPRLTKGEILGAWGLTEAGSGSDAGGMRTVAVKQGDGWLLNGSKNFITHGTVGDVCVVLAVTDRASRTNGITGFIVEKGAKGFMPAKKERKLGMRSSDTSVVTMEDAWVPDSNRLGEVGEGFKDAMKVLDGGRISIAALAVGLAQGAFELAVKYSQQREQFGKPIGSFQAIQFFLADMATQIDAARLLVQKAASMKSQGCNTTLESSQAKLFAAEVASWVTNKAIQIHGGYGFINEYVVEKHYRDVKLVEIGEGTNEVQRMVIARELLKKAAI